MKITNLFSLVFLSILLTNCNQTKQAMQTDKTSGQNMQLKVLIIDGENNHGYWPKTTMMMKDYLEETGLFKVDINRTAFTWQGGAYDKSVAPENVTDLLTMYPLTTGGETTIVEEATPDPSFSPDFKKYDVVISNMGWGASTWDDKTKKNFEDFVAQGGGLVVIHAANNSWGDWDEYNKMIGIGGWGGRNENSGVYASHDDKGKLALVTPAGNCGDHGPQHEYTLKTRAADHPIMKGLPMEWLHTKDELYQLLCGPGENMTVLASAYSDPEKNGKKASGRHEPMLLSLDYGTGRVFHSALGHMDYSMECVGFITTLQRGTEWAATGKVTQKIPKDFPGSGETSSRKWGK